MLNVFTVSPAKETWTYGLTRSLVWPPKACLRLDIMDEFILGSPSALYTLTMNLALCLELVTPTGTRRFASMSSSSRSLLGGILTASPLVMTLMSHLR